LLLQSDRGRRDLHSFPTRRSSDLARPVGAHSMHFTPLARRIIRIEFTSVVLPTPGPPVMTTTRFATAIFTASRWLGARVLPVCRSEEHTSELQSRFDLVCRLLLEK